MRRCGSNLASVLTGETDPLSLLFVGGDVSEAEQLYEDSPIVRLTNTVCREAIEWTVRRLPPERPLRVLEIGAGTGGLTTHVLPCLPADRTEYIFSDVSSHFLGPRQKLAKFPFVRYQTLDIEADAGAGPRARLVRSRVGLARAPRHS